MPQATREPIPASLSEAIQNDPVSSLPFVRWPGEYWEVEVTSDYGADCKRGAEYARQAILAIQSTGFTPLIGLVVWAMVRKGEFNGVVVGFMHALSEAATAINIREGTIDFRKAVFQ